MRIEDLWIELEREVQAGSAATWLSRFALPETGIPILVAIETASRRRVLLLPSQSSPLPPHREWPQCRGLEVFSIALQGVPHLGVRLIDANFADVFTALAEDVAPRVAAASDEHAAVIALLDRLRRWQKFLTARSSEFSVSRQRGLFGELWVLQRWLLPGFGAGASVRCWRAPQASHQDFQLANGAVEVKTTTEKQPQAVRITSERQLDDTGIRALFLFVVVLDERVTDTPSASDGESLPGIIAALRRGLDVADSVARLDFDDKLLDVGYLDADGPRFESRRFALRSEYCFHVRDGFPRLLERQLSAGVGDVSYALALAACQPFAISPSDMISTLTPSDQASPESGHAGR
jgi:hypothetical protein